MPTVQEALARMAPALEKELASRLTGFLGGLLRAYLPQSWVFQSESESVTLRVDRQGKATVSPGVAADADVTVEAKNAILLKALTQGSKAKAQPADFHVTTHTKKGETAFRFLRERFGF